MNLQSLYELYLRNPSVQTDTRKLQPGDIFFALKGENFNGNKFAQQAIEAGAACAVIDEAVYAIEGKTFLVEDVLTTLQALAKHHRQQFTIPFIAITGSNGKTTTKELVHAVLSRKYRTATTEGNLNNHIGIPLTILKVKADAEIAVIEMGANHQREIAGYCTYTMPDFGIITNCGKAHLEGFGGEEGVRKGKGELYDWLREHDGTAFVMWDYDYLRTMSQGITNIITYGTTDASLQGHAVKSEPFLEVDITHGASTGTIRSQLVGDYNLPNILLAVTIGKHFGVPDEDIRKAIEEYQPSNSRSQLLKAGSNQIILDAYNANPSSMKLAIENFARLAASNKVLMLGAMAELGEESLSEHQQIIDLIARFSWNKVILVGGDFLKLKHPWLSFHNSGEAQQWFREQEFENTHFLIKGSRSMKMEKILEA